MPKGLRRFHSGGDEHFITCSCYHREPFLAAANRRDLFLKILEEETVVQIPLWQASCGLLFGKNATMTSTSSASTNMPRS
jgi:hypothetical protein